MVWLLWINDDKSVDRVEFVSVRQGIRWHNRLFFLEQGYRAVKAYADHAGPADIAQAKQFYLVWLKLAADFHHLYMWGPESCVPKDQRERFNAAFLWVLRHEQGNI